MDTACNVTKLCQQTGFDNTNMMGSLFKLLYLSLVEANGLTQTPSSLFRGKVQYLERSWQCSQSQARLEHSTTKSQGEHHIHCVVLTLMTKVQFMNHYNLLLWRIYQPLSFSISAIFITLFFMLIFFAETYILFLHKMNSLPHNFFSLIEQNHQNLLTFLF